MHQLTHARAWQAVKFKPRTRQKVNAAVKKAIRLSKKAGMVHNLSKKEQKAADKLLGLQIANIKQAAEREQEMQQELAQVDDDMEKELKAKGKALPKAVDIRISNPLVDMDLGDDDDDSWASSEEEKEPDPEPEPEPEPKKKAKKKDKSAPAPEPQPEPEPDPDPDPEPEPEPEPDASGNDDGIFRMTSTEVVFDAPPPTPQAEAAPPGETEKERKKREKKEAAEAKKKAKEEEKARKKREKEDAKAAKKAPSEAKQPKEAKKAEKEVEATVKAESKQSVGVKVSNPLAAADDPEEPDEEEQPEPPQEEVKPAEESKNEPDVAESSSSTKEGQLGATSEEPAEGTVAAAVDKLNASSSWWKYTHGEQAFYLNTETGQQQLESPEEGIKDEVEAVSAGTTAEQFQETLTKLKEAPAEPEPEPEPEVTEVEQPERVAPENYSKMKPKQLEAACKKRGLESKGKKKELIKRLERYDSSAEPEPKKLSKKELKKAKLHEQLQQQREHDQQVREEIEVVHDHEVPKPKRAEPTADAEATDSAKATTKAGKLKASVVKLEHEVVKDAVLVEKEIVKDTKLVVKGAAKGAVAVEKELVKDVKLVEKELIKDTKAVAHALAAGPMPNEEQLVHDEDEREAARKKQRDKLQEKAEKQRDRAAKEREARAKKVSCSLHLDMVPYCRIGSDRVCLLQRQKEEEKAEKKATKALAKQETKAEEKALKAAQKREMFPTPQEVEERERKARIEKLAAEDRRRIAEARAKEGITDPVDWDEDEDATPAGEPVGKGPLQPQDAVAGMDVRLIADTGATGKLLKRDGQRARVDFSGSGGQSSKWVQCSELEGWEAVAKQPAAEPEAADDGGVWQLADESDEAFELRTKLQPMRIMLLQDRAVSEGVSMELVDAALEADDPKAALIALIVKASVDAKAAAEPCVIFGFVLTVVPMTNNN